VGQLVSCLVAWEEEGGLYHDMANWPVEGSDMFLHLSCVMVDMISIMQARFSPFDVGSSRGRMKEEKRQERRRNLEKVKGL
jgi:hypothetical protein